MVPRLSKFSPVALVVLLLVVFAVATPPVVNADTPGDMVWLDQFGTTGRDGTSDIKVDDSAIYFGGRTLGTFPGETSSGGLDAVLQKRDKDGSVIWTEQFGTSSMDWILGMDVDASGVYVTGSTLGTLPGETPVGADDSFVRKYDKDGNILWTTQFGTTARDVGINVAVFAGESYATTWTEGAFPGETSAGGPDVSLTKLDSSGNVIWSDQFGTAGQDGPSGIATDSTGVYVYGLVPSALPGQIHLGQRDLFVRKYDFDGGVIWTRQFGTAGDEFANRMNAYDGGVYLSAQTFGTFPGETNFGNWDAVLIKMDRDGNTVWVNQYGTSGEDTARDVAPTGAGPVVSGETRGTFPGQVASGSVDAHVEQFDHDGNLLWLNQYGTAAIETGYEIAADESAAYVAGDAYGTFPGETNLGADDPYIAKFAVEEPNQPPEVAADNSLVTVAEGVDAQNTGTVIDQDGDAIVLSASVGTVTNKDDDTWSWSFPSSDGPAESQTVTITADDGNGGTAQATFEITVNNVAPAVDSITVPLEPIDITDQPVSVYAAFSDPAGASDEPYTGAVDYGDGTGPEAGTVSGMTLIGPDHSYVEPGVYTVTVAVTDKDGGIGTSQATQVIVIYDPEGGFVTGGGWIESPSGAYTPDPLLTGTANFGFVSKYKKGAQIPTGQTVFQFRVADMNFHSDSYEWLVVANHKATYKGVGTVNGEGIYGFMLSAIDEDLTPSTDIDLFRIKIWNKDNGGGVVYDNKMGAGEDTDPTTAIGGGNIKIHKK